MLRHKESNICTSLDKASISAEELAPLVDPLDLTCLGPKGDIKSKEKQRWRSEKSFMIKIIGKNTESFWIRYDKKPTRGTFRTELVA